MVPAGDIVTYKNSNLVEDWTVVLPRRRKCTRKYPRLPGAKQDEKPWFSTDLQFDRPRYSLVVQKVHLCLKKLENSKFFRLFMSQIQNNTIWDHFSKARGSNLKMQMVIYGIGSIESLDASRLQLSLAILMKRKLDWIGNIEVFDPILSATESRVLESFGCSVIKINEQGRRRAVKPTLFFMPHCEAFLYENLLEVNWEKHLLTNMVILGNRFSEYKKHASVAKDSMLSDSRKHILAACEFTGEFTIDVVSDDFFRAFHETSWLFFNTKLIKVSL